MTSSVICMSRTMGAGAEDVASRVAERLGFRYVDDEVIQRASEASGVSTETLTSAERRKPLVERIVMALGSAGGAANVEGYTYYVDRPPDYEALIVEVLHEIAREGAVVIVAHAASMALGGSEGVLRVLITSSPETRASRLMKSDGLGDRDAEKAVKDSDGERQDYFRRFYKIREELPTHYDVVLNTDVLTVEQTANLIVAAASR